MYIYNFNLIATLRAARLCIINWKFLELVIQYLCILSFCGVLHEHEAMPMIEDSILYHVGELKGSLVKLHHHIYHVINQFCFLSRNLVKIVFF
ncbi:hypothetical protein QQP08_020485 [Theobroma cacao]|nr:hypothetical protein QQP08_020485 [Theobroma cacao]